jgi:hypothetical protein
MILVDAEVHFEHVQVIRSNIQTESDEKCKCSKWANFQKRARGNTLTPIISNTAIFSWGWK